jgi:adenylate cyclase
MTQTCSLAAILAAEFGRLFGGDEDEEGTLERLKALRGELVDPKITDHHGRNVKSTGDGLLAGFSCVVEALFGATEVQGSAWLSETPGCRWTTGGERPPLKSA